MSNAVKFVTDLSIEHAVLAPRTLYDASFECQHHGDIGNLVTQLVVTNGTEEATTGPLCVQCLADMFRCCRAEPKTTPAAEPPDCSNCGRNVGAGCSAMQQHPQDAGYGQPYCDGYKGPSSDKA